MPLGWHGQSPQSAFCAFGTITRRSSGKSPNDIKQSTVKHVVLVGFSPRIPSIRWVGGGGGCFLMVHDYSIHLQKVVNGFLFWRMLLQPKKHVRFEEDRFSE